MKKTAILMSALLALSVMGCKDDNSKKSEESKQEQQKDPQKDEPKGPTQEELNKQHDDALMAKVGKACDTYMGSCFSDNSKVLACTDTDSDKDTKWRVIDCGTDAYCVEENGYAACAEKCDPNDQEIIKMSEIYCNEVPTLSAKTYLMDRAVCQLAPNSKDIYTIVEDFQYCSDCSTDNLGTCTIKDSDKGLNLKAGDACNPALFASRCDGNKAINCIVNNLNNFEYTEDEYISVIADVERTNKLTAQVFIEECASECQVLNVINDTSALTSYFYTHPGKLAFCSNNFNNKIDDDEFYYELYNFIYNEDNGKCSLYYFDATIDSENNLIYSSPNIKNSDTADGCSDMKEEYEEIIKDFSPTQD